MPGKYIKIVTFLSLVVIVAIQGSWLVHTYRLIETELLQVGNRLFPQAVVDEAKTRLDRLSDAQGEDITLSFSTNFDYQREIDQTLFEYLAVLANDYADSVYHSSISLPLADSIFTARLAQEGYQAQVKCQLIDSLGVPLQEEDVSAWHHPFKTLRTNPVYLNREHTQAVRATILNPYWIAFRQMGVLLVATALLLVFVAGCFVYQVHIIIRQNRIARLRQDFTYAMLHDMKTPITTISMTGHTLESGLLDQNPELKKQYFAILHEESAHLLGLSEKILTIAKLEQSHLKLAQESVSLPALFDELTQKYRVQSDKEVTLETHCPDSLLVTADAEYLKEALGNLIDNSLKYSDERVTIRLSAEEQSHTVLIKVWDNGWGIPLKRQKHIFEKFDRGGLEYKKEKKVSGFGLGLNFVHKVITAMGGSVSVNSIEGKFSEFTLILPVQNKKL
ncbi:sensor histidine kinase [Phocaeicola barnesiae]|uniref:sensor histidine kinase n=1 Tax=Phocaeicola barnesiae TaxID=376804 RepID=UPI001D949832|nr:HAMP domain-containing sensor histidine kinase [Phocaeicola barnesiae]HJG78598.1 HAMP domain-containing histidine kinase [Phocaeicola barnesiae]